MKIAQITPGAGGMYCGSCLNDAALATAMIRQGHDVTLIPIYTPIRTEGNDVSIDRVFYGAVNVFLEQKLSLFRHTPRLLDRLFNAPSVLKWAAARGGTTDPRSLGPLTLSMLRGEQGHQKKELERLVEWLRDDERPEIVHLSNSMLLGLARRLKEELGVPVVCSIQGEDLFLEGLDQPWRDRVRDELGRRARDVDGFVAPSVYYADYMAEAYGLPRERIHRVRLGISTGEFAKPRTIPSGDRPFVVGYLARVAPEKGLHLLAEAFRTLADELGSDAVRLHIAGFVGERDRPYLDGIISRLRDWGLGPAVRHEGEVDRDGKVEFLHGLDVLAVPTVYREPKGRFVLEALAAGVPVVQPRHGSFPEMIEETGGGVLFEPGSVKELADALRHLAARPEQRDELADRGRRAVLRDWSDDAAATATLAVYREYVSERGDEGRPHPGRAVAR